MSVSERRAARRFIINVPFQLQPTKTPSLAARATKAMNVSTRGVYFATHLPLCQGQLVQVLLQMPIEVTGKVVNESASLVGLRTCTPMSLQTGCQEWGCNSYITRRLLSNSESRSKKFPRRVPSSRDFSLKKSHNSPGTRSPARGSQQALSVATISMSCLLAPMRWDFALPTLRAKDSPPPS